MDNLTYAILITSGERLLVEWRGDFAAVQKLYERARKNINLDEQDHHWAWDGCAREIVWKIIAENGEVTDDLRALLIWWVAHFSLGNAVTPVSMCIFRRQFDVRLGQITEPRRYTWVDIELGTARRDPPPEFIAFTLHS